MRGAANKRQGYLLIVAICCFAFAGLCSTIRLLRGPGLADRIMALDVTLICLMGAIAVDAARRDDTTNLVLLIVLAIVGFTATVAASKFIEQHHDPAGHSSPGRSGS